MQVLWIAKHTVFSYLQTIDENIVNSSFYRLLKPKAVVGTFRAEWTGLRHQPGVLHTGSYQLDGLIIGLGIEVAHQNNRMVALIDFMDLIQDQAGRIAAGLLPYMIKMGIENPKMLSALLVSKQHTGANTLHSSVPANRRLPGCLRQPEGVVLQQGEQTMVIIDR